MCRLHIFQCTQLRVEFIEYFRDKFKLQYTHTHTQRTPTMSTVFYMGIGVVVSLPFLFRGLGHEKSENFSVNNNTHNTLPTESPTNNTEMQMCCATAWNAWNSDVYIYGYSIYMGILYQPLPQRLMSAPTEGAWYGICYNYRYTSIPDAHILFIIMNYILRSQIPLHIQESMGYMYELSS